MARQGILERLAARRSVEAWLVRLPHFATGLAGVAFCFAFYYHLDKEGPVSPLGSLDIPATHEGTPLRNAPDPAEIATWHLFGVQETSDKAEVRVEAPETRLNLALKGVFLDKDEQRARAIISTASGEDQYAIGDSVTGNVSLRAIERYRVIIERNGRLESLSLPRATVTNQVLDPSSGQAQKEGPRTAGHQAHRSKDVRPRRSGRLGRAAVRSTFRPPESDVDT